MKILQINCVYQFGSTGKIVSDIHKELLKRSIESVVCYGRGSKISEPSVYKFCPELLANLHTFVIRTGIILNYGGNLLPTYRLIKIIEREKPDVVHVHCANGSCVNIYRLFEYLASHKIKTVITHHAEFYYTGSCEHAFECTQFINMDGCKKCPRVFAATRSRTWDNSGRAWRSMRKAISNFDYNDLFFTSVSPWLKTRSAKSSIVNKYRCEAVLNGVDTEVFRYLNERNIIRNKVDNINKKIALYVCASFNPLDKNDNKGGWYLVELAKRMPDVLFVIVALRSTGESNYADNIVLWGSAKSQQELASLYRSADVLVLTSRRETFSMPTAESLCCGTPVIGFEAGGPESIALSQYSKFVDYGNIEALQSDVTFILNTNYNKRDISYCACKSFAREVMTNNYYRIYKELIK